jgi:DNA repair protein RecN (Recombination protein N)
LRRASDGVAEDPARLEYVRSRRQLLRQLRRKYGETLAEVLAYRDEIGERLAQLEHHDEHAHRLQAEIAASAARAEAAARRLRQARQDAAAPFAAAVSAYLRDLAMPKARFEVALEPTQPSDEGADAVTFLLAANAGEPLRPLARAASGGELARAMLALRLVGTDAPETLVFDEVDAGIGGEAGTAVGRLLAVLAGRHQVLCVTHLAQVAAFADRQVVVEKAERRGRTVATAGAVEDEARVRELSRMLAGVGESDHARRHAAELLATARRHDRARASVGRR